LAREIGPILSDFLEISETPRAPTVDPQQEQRRLFGATRRLIAWLARRQPLALVLDDLQWADLSSLEAIGHIVDLILDAPLAVIAIARPVARPTLVPILNLSDSSQTQTFLDIQLNALSATDNERLLSLILAEAALPAALQKALLDRSAGIPLLLEEITRMLLDEGVIYKTTAGWAVRPNWPSIIRQVPNTVNGLVLSRYDRLPSQLQHILDIAAVFKRHFSLIELSAMANVPIATINDWVRDLEQARGDLSNHPRCRTPIPSPQNR
jgi:predicted ATPase